ncbi:MAG: glycosidase [Armatimonadetes bacterium]|nr:glycosidase [Armatimonadota bacterium]
MQTTVSKAIFAERYSGNPVLKPTDNWWETRAVFNAAVAEHEGKIHMLYRALGEDMISRFGYAVSEDGFRFERSRVPAYEAPENDPFERLGCEDPRITVIDGTFYIAYVGTSVYPAAENRKPTFGIGPPWRCRVSLLSTRDFKSFTRHGVILPEFDDKNAVLFPEKIGGKYVMYHRILPDMWISYSDDLIHWDNHKLLMAPKAGSWDCERIGAGAPPIKTSDGWLNFYHGVDNDRIYRLGIFLSDLEDPSKVIARSAVPIMGPEEPFECIGPICNVIFTCGVVERNGKYLIYYGAADSTISVATTDRERLRDVEMIYE